jgi:hypothetical protein
MIENNMLNKLMESILEKGIYKDPIVLGESSKYYNFKNACLKSKYVNFITSNHIKFKEFKFEYNIFNILDEMKQSILYIINVIPGIESDAFVNISEKVSLNISVSKNTINPIIRIRLFWIGESDDLNKIDVLDFDYNKINENELRIKDTKTPINETIIRLKYNNENYFITKNRVYREEELEYNSSNKELNLESSADNSDIIKKILSCYIDGVKDPSNIKEYNGLITDNKTDRKSFKVKVYKKTHNKTIK